MVLNHLDKKSDGFVRLLYENDTFEGLTYEEEHENTLTIVWNRGEDQQIVVDEEQVVLPKDHVIVFNVNQSFQFQHSKELVIWQFNRSFYCIIDHDHEVSCAGLLFYGSKGIPIIKLESEVKQSLNLIFQVFLDEFGEEDDNLKSEMLRVILKRLIVKLTRAYKVQHALESVESKDLDLVRQFNVLVEKNFRKLHQVQEYADLLNRSSKTISNIFSRYSDRSPLETIHERILLEAKRLLLYTGKTTKEIAYEIGFQDIPGFSRFFKKHTQIAPSKFRGSHALQLVGKN